MKKKNVSWLLHPTSLFLVSLKKDIQIEAIYLSHACCYSLENGRRRSLHAAISKVYTKPHCYWICKILSFFQSEKNCSVPQNKELCQTIIKSSCCAVWGNCSNGRDNKSRVTTANGTTLLSYRPGTIKLQTQSNDIDLNEVLYFPNIESILLPVTKSVKHCCKLTFENNHLQFNHPIMRVTFIEDKIINNLYEIDLWRTWKLCQFSSSLQE